MKNIGRLFIVLLLLTASFAGARDTVESPKTCAQCGMDRTAFAQSRMLVIYADGSTVGVCSLHCAAEVLQQHKDKQVRSLMVADYSTQELLDAKTATWVVGGKKSGVMTALAKWAFTRPEAALIFREENGGMLDSFDLALDAATLEVMEQATEERAVEREMLSEQH